jgi:ribosome biogenesis GTPase
MKGIVYKSTGSWYLVKSDEGKVYNARLKGRFKVEGIKSTNPIAVGDEVAFELEDELENRVMIHELFPRKNYVNRVSPANRRLHHIIASNLDQSLLVATLREPKTSVGFIDRFLVTCEAFHIPAVVVFNKADIYSEQDMILFEDRKSMYSSIGYPVLLASIYQEDSLNAIRNTLQNQVSLISGHSGVGKSSLINHLLEDTYIRTTEVSSWSGKGMHTTTFAEMYDIPGGGRLIDTPGMREFDIADIDKAELSHYFPEMRALLNDCQFNNCMHMNEPGCAIKEAVIAGKIHEERYVSYCSISDSIRGKVW